MTTIRFMDKVMQDVYMIWQDWNTNLAISLLIYGNLLFCILGRITLTCSTEMFLCVLQLIMLF